MNLACPSLLPNLLRTFALMARRKPQPDDDARKFNWKNWKELKRIAPYLRPHAWGYFIGILMISVSSVFTLLVTRLWGQLGGIGVSGEGGGGSGVGESGGGGEGHCGLGGGGLGAGLSGVGG